MRMKADELVKAMQAFGVDFAEMSKAFKEFAKEHTDIDMKKLRRREQYLRQYRNRGKRR